MKSGKLVKQLLPPKNKLATPRTFPQTKQSSRLKSAKQAVSEPDAAEIRDIYECVECNLGKMYSPAEILLTSESESDASSSLLGPLNRFRGCAGPLSLLLM